MLDVRIIIFDRLPLINYLCSVGFFYIFFSVLGIIARGLRAKGLRV